MASIQDGDQIGVKQSASQNKRVKVAIPSGTRVISITITPIAYQSRQYEYQLNNLHINQCHVNFNDVICVSIKDV